MATYAWAKKGQAERKVFLHWTEDFSAVSIRTATADEIKEKPDRCFTPSTETGELWLSILASGKPLARSNAMLTGKTVNAETGNADAFVPEITINRLSKDKTKIEKKPHAFSRAQLEAMGDAPQNLHLCSNQFGGPLLIVGMIPYTAKKKAKKVKDEPQLERIRLAAETAAEAAGEPEIVRVRGGK